MWCPEYFEFPTLGTITFPRCDASSTGNFVSAIMDCGASMSSVSFRTHDRLIDYYVSVVGKEGLSSHYDPNACSKVNTSAGESQSGGVIELSGTYRGMPFSVWATVMSHDNVDILVGIDIMEKCNIKLVHADGKSFPTFEEVEKQSISNEQNTHEGSFLPPYEKSDWVYLHHPESFELFSSPFWQEVVKANEKELSAALEGQICVLAEISVEPTPPIIPNQPKISLEEKKKAYSSRYTPDGVDKDALDLVKDLGMEIDTSRLTAKQADELHALLAEYKNRIFAHSEVDIGCTDLFTHKIELLPGSRPVKQNLRNVTQAQEEHVRKEIEKYLKFGVISPAQSEWCSPIVLAPKADGSIRFCIDFRIVNRMTKVDSYPVPNQQYLLSKMKGARYFSSFDLCSAYWQIPMDPESKDATTFTSPMGIFRWEVMPFGLLNSGSSFCRLVQEAYKEQVGKSILG